jgi:heme exporter protein B
VTATLFLRDVRLAFRAGGALTPLLFFLAVIATAPFAIGPDLALLARIGPALLWTAALLSALLGLDRLFQADREDGSLDMLVAGQDAPSLALLVLAKCLAHWVTGLLPLALAAPFLGLLLNVEWTGGLAVALTLLAGTPGLSFAGAVGAAVAVSLPRGGLLVSVLALPLSVPVVIFGVSAARAALADPDPFLPPFLLLCASTLFLAVVGPLGAALALKGGE